MQYIHVLGLYYIEFIYLYLSHKSIMHSKRDEYLRDIISTWEIICAHTRINVE